MLMPKVFSCKCEIIFDLGLIKENHLGPKIIYFLNNNKENIFLKILMQFP